MKKPSKQPIRKYSTKKIINKLKRGLHSDCAIPFILLIIVGVLVLYPMVMLLITSFKHEGVYNASSYIGVFTSKSTYKAFFNTLQMILGVLIGTWVVGGGFAFIRHKTDFDQKKLLDQLVFLSFTIPSYILSVAWIQFASRGGFFSRLLKVIWPSLRYTFNAYTIGACSVILVFHLYPLVYYGVGNAIQLIDPSIERSAKTCGAKDSQVLFKIILPLIMPSFISTGLLVVSRSMANFGVPAQVALPKGKEVLTTQVFSSMANLDLAMVSVLSLLLMVISLVMYLISERFLKRKQYQIEANERSGDRYYLSLGKWQGIVKAFVRVFFFISIVIPFTTILGASVFKRWGLAFKLDNLTLANYKRLFLNGDLLLNPLMNSLSYGISAGLIALIIASLTVYFVKYRNNFLSGTLLNVSQLPIAIPNIILAVAAMFAWINDPFKLYGTKWIIIVTYVILFIPICIKQIFGAARNLHVNMDAAAMSAGIPLLQRFWKLYIPQMKSSMISGFLICFLISLKEIPISLLLYTVNTKTLGVLVFTIQSNSYGLEMTSTVSVLVIALSIIGHLVLLKIGSRGYKI